MNTTIAKTIDHTMLKADATTETIKKYCDEAKEYARLLKELRDTQDALEILKKAISILGN